MIVERKHAWRKCRIPITAILIITSACIAGCGKSSTAESGSRKDASSAESERTEEAVAQSVEPELKEDPAAPSAEPELKEDLDAGDGWFVWDLNGDGDLEEFSVDHIANGDEAADVGIITRMDDGSAATIDRFYGIEKITGNEDENGRYLEIAYYTGDFYDQTPGAECVLRDISGKLDIRRISGKEPGAFFDFMDDHMSLKFYENFDGEYFPVSVTDAAMGEPAYEITDEGAIKEIFEALKKVKIGGQTDNVLLDGDRWLTFRFENGDKKVYLFYGDEQVYFQEFVYEITDDGGLFKVIEEADRLESTTQSEGIGGGS